MSRCLPACLTGSVMAAAAGESISVRGCQVMWCSVREIVLPVEQVDGVLLGKHKGYNCV